MCGIVGYTGTRPVKDILIEGLSRLEYRGYDSAGIAVEQDGKLVGAVTHVLVNDPTRGYGIFAQTMLETADILATQGKSNAPDPLGLLSSSGCFERPGANCWNGEGKLSKNGKNWNLVLQ